MANLNEIMNEISLSMIKYNSHQFKDKNVFKTRILSERLRNSSVVGVILCTKHLSLYKTYRFLHQNETSKQ